VVLVLVQSWQCFVTPLAGSIVGIIDNNFKLGEPYTLKLGVGKGKATLWYATSDKGSLTKPAFTVPVHCKVDTYFKSGLYLQSNTVRTIRGAKEKPGTWAEMNIYHLKQWTE
jgi:hypothetical protein